MSRTSEVSLFGMPFREPPGGRVPFGAGIGTQRHSAAPRSSTTVAFLMRCCELLPDGWERMDERRVDRGNIGAVGRIVAGGEGADAPVVHTGPGGGLGGAVFFLGAWGGAGRDGGGGGGGGRGA